MTLSKRILVIASHPDDEVLGCGGTVARHAHDGDDVHILIMAEGATSRDLKRRDKARNAEIDALRHAAASVADTLGTRTPLFAGLHDNRMDNANFLDIVKIIEQVVTDIKPETVYTHHGNDLNIDHRLTNQAALTACRPLPNASVKHIYTFETLSSTEWSDPTIGKSFMPNMYVNIEPYLDAKLEALAHYESEMRASPHPRSMEGVHTLAKLRGLHSGMLYAEAFCILRHIR
ncbi:MAG: PIG-L family deacetylase [Rhodospirillales bacterium]|nr:PIG-L family deacetylase [Rhodospirillales bacterium]